MHQTSNLICEEVDLQTKSDIAVERLANQLYGLVDKYYLIDSYQSYKDKILLPESPGNLVLYYFNQQLVGFTRLARRILTIHNMNYAIYYGGSYQEPTINLNAYAARVCLLQALRFKLFQPNIQLVYLANANIPQRYNFIRGISDQVEPKEDGSCSRLVKQLMKELCKLNDWPYNPEYPQLVKGLVPLKPIWSKYTNTNMDEFLRLNPEYMAGDSLFMYFPLDMHSLGRYINRSVSDSVIIGSATEHA